MKAKPFVFAALLLVAVLACHGANRAFALVRTIPATTGLTASETLPRRATEIVRVAARLLVCVARSTSGA